MHYFVNFTDLQPSKASVPTFTFFSEFSITTSRFTQPLNAPKSILETLLGIEMLVKLLQPENASSSMLGTLLGIEMLAKLLQSLNAPHPM